MPQLLIKDGIFPLNVQCLFDLNLEFWGGNGIFEAAKQYTDV